MANTTMGVKLDEATRDRIKSAAQRIDRTPHWLIKQAIFNYLEKLESNSELPELATTSSLSLQDTEDAIPQLTENTHQPFLDFAEHVLPQSVTRAAITAAYRRPETKRSPCYWNKHAYPQI